MGNTEILCTFAPMKQTLLILTGYLMMALTAMADNKQVEQLYDAADAAYAQQNYKEAERLAKEALPLSKGTEMEVQELREKYDVLNEQYDNAIASGTKGELMELNATDRDFIEKTVNIINELILSGQIDANHVAERLGMSLFQFRQRLTALTDETPQNFIQNVRMKRARHLLDNHPELNVSEIATLCAYNDTPNFTRAFKKTFGVTPTQYLDRKG